ncbi:MAG: hypothetical protein J6P44_02310 [Bacteroidales bacterium]|nr:hypothetical protein [Bacteroidales bacterium]
MKVYVLAEESVDMPEFEFNILGVFKDRKEASIRMLDELDKRFCEGFEENYNRDNTEISLSSGSLDVVYYIKEMELQ